MITGEEDGNLYNHLGDGAVYNGVLYVPLEYYNAGVHSSERIVTLQTSDLVVIGCEDVSAQNFELAGCYVDATYVYIVSYTGSNNKIHRYNTSNLTYASDITLSTSSMTGMQGIDFDGTYFQISHTGIYISQVKADGTFMSKAYRTPSAAADVEGVCWLSDQDRLALLYDPGADERVYILRRTPGKIGATSAGFDGLGDTIPKTSPAGLDSLTAFTFEAWAYYIGDVAENRILDRESSFGFKVYYTGGSHTLQAWRGAWKLQDIGESPLNDWHYFVASWNGSNITFYYDGAQIGSPQALTGTTGAANNLLVGSWKGTSSWLFASMDEIRISDTGRSSDWISVSYNNQNSPGTFYSVVVVADETFDARLNRPLVSSLRRSRYDF